MRYLGQFGADGPGAVQPGSVVVGPDGKDLVVPAFGPGVLRPLAASGAVPARLGSRSEAADSGELGSRSPDGSDPELGSRSSGVQPELGSRSSTAGATGPEAELGSRQSHRSAAQLGSRPEGGPGQLGSRFDPASGSDLGSRLDDGPTGLGSRSGDGADADLGSRSPASTPAAARPRGLPNGSWCVLSREEVAPGDQVQVRPGCARHRRPV